MVEWNLFNKILAAIIIIFTLCTWGFFIREKRAIWYLVPGWIAAAVCFFVAFYIYRQRDILGLVCLPASFVAFSVAIFQFFESHEELNRRMKRTSEPKKESFELDGHDVP